MTRSEHETPVPDVPVTVIGGYLGSGKTTLVNHLLRTGGERLAVLVNDFGDVDIDADLIESDDGTTISLANGCICCSLADGLAAGLDTLAALNPPPRRIVVETSGVADPSSVAAYAHAPGLALDAVVVVVDVETVRQRADDRYVGDTIAAQLRAGDILVLNKTDLIGPADLEALRAWLALQRPGAVTVATEQARVDPALLFGVAPPSGRAAPAGAGNTAAGQPAGTVYQSWSWRHPDPISRSAIDRVMAELPDTVVRAKGVLRLVEEPARVLVLQRVGRRWSLRPLRSGGDGPCRLVLIGLTGAVEEGWLAERLSG